MLFLLLLLWSKSYISLLIMIRKVNFAVFPFDLILFSPVEPIIIPKITINLKQQ